MTRAIAPGQTVPVPFTLSETPDSTPTVTVYQSTADGVLANVTMLVSPVVVSLSGLAYHAAFTALVDAEHGTAYQLLVSVTIAGETTTHWLDGGTVELWASQASVDGIKAKTDLLGTAGTEVAQIINTGVGAGGKLRFRKGDAFDETFAVPGSIATDDRIVLTVKSDRSDADDAAILKVDSASGLVVIEGNVPGGGQTGSVSIVNANERTIRLVLSADAAASLTGRAQAVHYDVKRFPSAGDPTGVAVGLATIAHAVTHEV